MDALIDNPKDGSRLALIPEGEFLAGGASGSGAADGRPFAVRLPAYYLALHPVTNAQYARFLTETRPGEELLKRWILLDQECFVRSQGEGYEAYGGRDDHPMVRVSWYGAEAYAQWAGLRLPGELEWEKGARGTDGREFPWDGPWDWNKCRNATNRGTGRTCGVLSYPEGRSPYGLYQMAGNVWEWCADRFERGAYARYKDGDLTPPAAGETRVFRGGSWDYLNTDLFGCAFRLYNSPAYRFNDNGFRCARSAS
jgi:formylglycine-generating enzyme required for sulfatase activity